MKKFPVIFMNLISLATSFLLQSQSIHKTPFPHVKNKFDRNNGNSEMSAVILNWDEDSDSPSSYDAQQSELSQGGKGQAIASRLTESREKIASLARLAVAFAPTGHTPTLSDIENVEIICVDERHLEMSTAVCEEDGCVTIFVPISFPKDCGSDDMEECVLDNIFELDLQAQELLREMEKSGGQRKLSDEEIEERNLLHSHDNIVFPSWWVPSGTAMQEECDTLKRLLNEERFQKEVNALARKGLDVMDGGHFLTVLNAVVAVVGPAGFYMRAKTERTSQILGERTSSIVDIPLSFSGGIVAANSSDLRSNALRTLNDAINI